MLIMTVHSSGMSLNEESIVSMAFSSNFSISRSLISTTFLSENSGILSMLSVRTSTGNVLPSFVRLISFLSLPIVVSRSRSV